MLFVITFVQPYTYNPTAVLMVVIFVVQQPTVAIVLKQTDCKQAVYLNTAHFHSKTF